MAKTHRLTNLVFDEVSSVDKGAGKGVRVVLAKRDFSEKERQAAADKGHAMPDGSFPIKDEADLHNAIRLVGRAKDPGAAKAHIKERAKALGLEDSLPEDWVSKSTTENEAMPMTAAETAALEKQIAESVTKAVTAVTSKFEGEIAKRDEEIAILKLSPELQEFRKAMTPEEKKKFDAMTAEEKDEAAKETKKRAVDKLDPEIKKRLDQADQNEKVLKALVEKDEIATFEKRATGLGLPATDGEILRKAYSGDSAAQTELDKRLKALTEQVKVGKVFDEFGNGGPGKGDKSAYDEIVEKGAELRKTNPKLTPEQARVEVMSDPANADLMKRHNAEKVAKLSRAA